MANEREQSIEKLREMLEDIDFCMMTTMDGGQLHCRPMSTQAAEFDAEIWFFTRDDSHKISEIEKDNRVCLGYANPDDSTYVSVSGRAEMSKDRAKMEELWNPILKAWFPDGLEDPNICLMKVTVEQAEYWESPSGKVVQLLGFVKALATGQEANYGENRKIDLTH
jgi:general stress protein 26